MSALKMPSFSGFQTHADLSKLSQRLALGKKGNINHENAYLHNTEHRKGDGGNYVQKLQCLFNTRVSNVMSK